MSRWPLGTLAVLMLLPWVGCGGASRSQGGDDSTTTGGDGATVGTGGTMSDGGIAGDPDAGDAGQGQSGEGGEAGTRAGSAGIGGAAGLGGASGAGAVAGGGTGGRMVSIPTGWTCLSSVYQDGESCECGCGAPDPDCDDETRNGCDVCRALGSCSVNECPGAIAPDDNSRCALPPTWACATFHYGDGFCNCGCHAPDVDCADASPESCDNCPQSGCSPLDCENLLPNDNTACSSPPTAWECAGELYNDGRCHCGGGFMDSDCASTGSAACDVCDAEGSCSNSACPGVINVTSNWFCGRPQPPTEWTCDTYAFGDNNMCDCGCGTRDVDCGESQNVADCDSCTGCGDRYCNGTVDPADITRCLPPPEGWICNESDYGDFFCDCGCGALDSDCNNYRASDICYNCPAPGCAMGDCELVNPTNNTVCR